MVCAGGKSAGILCAGGPVLLTGPDSRFGAVGARGAVSTENPAPAAASSGALEIQC